MAGTDYRAVTARLLLLLGLSFGSALQATEGNAYVDAVLEALAAKGLLTGQEVHDEDGAYLPDTSED